jgi:hypothetical protein
LVAQEIANLRRKSWFVMGALDDVFECWDGILDDDFPVTIRKTFKIAEGDEYQYAAGTYQVTLAQVEQDIKHGHYKWIYWSPLKEKIQVSFPKSSPSSLPRTNCHVDIGCRHLSLHIDFRFNNGYCQDADVL